LAAGGYTTVNALASGAFYAPAGVAVDGSGDVFVVDHGNGSGGSNAGV
jgi:NHL repeat-containing protein